MRVLSSRRGDGCPGKLRIPRSSGSGLSLTSWRDSMTVGCARGGSRCNVPSICGTRLQKVKVLLESILRTQKILWGAPLPCPSPLIKTIRNFKLIQKWLKNFNGGLRPPAPPFRKSIRNSKLIPKWLKKFFQGGSTSLCPLLEKALEIQNLYLNISKTILRAPQPSCTPRYKKYY